MDWCAACHGMVDTDHRCRADPTPRDVTGLPAWEWRVGDTVRFPVGLLETPVLARIDRVQEVGDDLVFAFTVVDVDPAGGA